MIVLFFDISVSGHHIEYLHHLYQYLGNNPRDVFYFVLPSDFHNKKNIYEWSDYPNIHIISIPNEDLSVLKKGNNLKKMFLRVKLLRKYVKIIKPNIVFLITLMAFVPFLVLMIPKGVKVSGIVYRIYLYSWKSSSIFKKCFDTMNQLFLIKAEAISKVFVLNDKSAALFLNRKYHTNKFVYLTDPFNDIGYRGKDIRNEYNISSEDIVYLHFGGLAERKGTLDILKAISIIEKEEATHKVFIFAGMPSKEIQDDYYNIIGELKKEGKKVLSINEFCSNELLNDLCASSNYVLCPYKVTDVSSGVLSYAAFYKKPVIGPSNGLIGKIIRTYHLGIMLAIVSPEAISKAICDSIVFHANSGQDRYVNQLSIRSFCDIISINLKNSVI